VPPPQLQVTMFDTFCTSITQIYKYYADLYVLRRFTDITQICKHYAEFVSLRRFASITQNCKDNAGLMTLRSAGPRPPAPAHVRQLRPAHHRLMRVPLALAAAAARPFLRLPHPAHSRCYAVRGRLGSTDLQHMPSEGRLSWHSGAHPPPLLSPGRVTIRDGCLCQSTWHVPGICFD
jgi:hypothetical protein